MCVCYVLRRWQVAVWEADSSEAEEGLFTCHSCCVKGKPGFEGKPDGNIANDRLINVEINVWSTSQRLKRSKKMVLMYGLNETIDQLVVVGMIMY